MDGLSVTNGADIWPQVLRLDHALGAKDFHALIIAIGSLTGVGDGTDDAVGELHHDQGGVDITSLGNGGIDLAVALGVDLDDVGSGDEASHVEVMDLCMYVCMYVCGEEEERVAEIIRCVLCS